MDKNPLWTFIEEKIEECHKSSSLTLYQEPKFFYEKVFEFGSQVIFLRWEDMAMKKKFPNIIVIAENEKEIELHFRRSEGKSLNSLYSFEK